MGEPECPVIRRMPPRKPAPPPKRPIWPRLLTAILALAAMAWLWFVDTGALLLLGWQMLRANPWPSAAGLSVMLAALALSARLRRRKPKPKPKPRKKSAQNKI
jgi:membrane protein implicated in regulation of membrane protease activity